MENVTVQIDAKWAKIARSPVYGIVVALQGVSVTFAPLFLYWCGKGGYVSGYEWIIAPICFAVIFLVPLFHFQFSNAVIRGLRRAPLHNRFD
jgi:hypothetical protein